jgi:phage shock protein E
MAKSYEEMLDEAREETEQTDPDAVHDALESGEDITILDVRKPEEWEEGHIKGVKHLPRRLLELKAADELPDTDARIVTHCASGGGVRWRPGPWGKWATPTSPTWRAA